MIERRTVLWSPFYGETYENPLMETEWGPAHLTPSEQVAKMESRGWEDILYTEKDGEGTITARMESPVASGEIRIEYRGLPSWT